MDLTGDEVDDPVCPVDVWEIVWCGHLVGPVLGAEVDRWLVGAGDSVGTLRHAEGFHNLGEGGGSGTLGDAGGCRGEAV